MRSKWIGRAWALTALLGAIGFGGAPRADARTASYPTAVQLQAGEYVQDEVVVAFEPRLQSVRTLAAIAGGSADRRIGGGDDLLVLKVPTGSMLERIERLRNQPGVRFAEPNWIYHPAGEPDPSLPLQWSLHNPGTPEVECDGSDCATPDSDIDWPQAVMQLQGVEFAPATVAIIDTGIDLAHPDLVDRLVPGWDFIHDDPGPDDEYGHGTHVAGIAAASTFNDLGIGGVAYPETVRIMPLKVCDASGICPDSAIADAILWAADHGADVINMSLGNGAYSELMQGAIDVAWEAAEVVVAAAGNNAADRVSYPGAYEHVVAVGSLNWRDELAHYSNWGSELDLVAPGGEMSKPHDPGGIYSSTPNYPVTMGQGGRALSQGYDFMSGTSMASPQVAGLATLLRAIHPVFSNEEIIQLISDSADDLDSPGWDMRTGYGRINVCRAVGGTCGRGDDPPLPPDIWPPARAATPTPTSWRPMVLSIGGSLDDTFAYYSRGWVNAYNWEDAILYGDTWVGLRFAGLALPEGARVVHASLQVNVFGFDDPRLLIYAEANDRAADFSRSLPTERALTTASVRWRASNIGGGWRSSPDLAPIIQEVVSRPGWGSGDPIALILQNDGGQLRFRQWDYDHAPYAARLYLVYTDESGTTASPTPTAPPTATASPTATPIAQPTVTAIPTRTSTTTPSETGTRTSTFTATALPTATGTPLATETAATPTPTPPPTETEAPATATQPPGEDPRPVARSEETFYLRGEYNPARDGYWMSQQAPEGGYVSAWHAARFYSGEFPAGARIPAGTTFVCLNYVNGSGASRLLYVTLRAGGDPEGAVLIDAAPLWLPPSYSASRVCLRAATGAHTFGANGESGRLWLEIRFQSPTTAARALWDGRFGDSAIMLPRLELPPP